MKSMVTDGKFVLTCYPQVMLDEAGQCSRTR